MPCGQRPPAQLRLLHRGRVVASALPSGGSCSACESCSSRTKVTRAPNLLRVEIQDPVLEDEGHVYSARPGNVLGNASASANFNAQVRQGREHITWGQGWYLGPYSFATPSSEEGQLGKTTTSCQQRSSVSSPCPMGTQRGSFPPAPDREAGPLTLGTRGKPSGLRPISVSLCCLLSSHRPGHHTIAHAAGGHWSQPDLQGEPGAGGPANFTWFRDGALWAQGP